MKGRYPRAGGLKAYDPGRDELGVLYAIGRE